MRFGIDIKKRKIGEKMGSESSHFSHKNTEGKWVKKPTRYLSDEEKAQKTKNWSKGTPAPVTEKDKSDYQRRVGRSYDD